MQRNPCLTLFLLLMAGFCSAQSGEIIISLNESVASGIFVQDASPDFSLTSIQAHVGVYIEVDYHDDNGYIFFKQTSERFTLYSEQTIDSASLSSFTTVHFDNKYFTAPDSLPGALVLMVKDFNACIYLKKYNGEEVILGSQCRRFKNTYYKDQSEGAPILEPGANKRGFKKLPIGISGGQAEYFARYSNDNFFGDERPEFYQTLVLNCNVDLAGIPLKSAITMTNGKFNFRQSPNVFRLEFDPQTYQQRQKEKLSSTEHLQRLKVEDYKGQLDSLTNLLNGIDHTLKSPSFQQQLGKLRQKDSLDLLLTQQGELLDTAQFRQILNERKSLSDSLPNEKYLKRLMKTRMMFEESVGKLRKLSVSQDSLLNIPDTMQTDTLDALKNSNPFLSFVNDKILSNITNFGVGTVFFPISKYSISGAPINGFKGGIKVGEVEYSVASGQLTRNTTNAEWMHEVRNKAWISIAGIETRTPKALFRMHYVYTYEKNQLNEVVRRNHVIPIQFEYRLGKRLNSKTELSISSVFSREVEQSMFLELAEGLNDSGYTITPFPMLSRLGYAFNQSLEFSLSKRVNLRYSVETISRNYHSIPEPFLMTGITNQELGAKANVLKNKVRIYSGLVYSYRNENGKKYTRLQQKVRLQMAFPRKPTLNVDYIPTFMEAYGRKYTTNLLNVGSNYVWKRWGTVFISNGSHTNMALMQEGEFSLLKQSSLVQAAERKNYSASLGFFMLNNLVRGNQAIHRFFQADIRYKIGKLWTAKARGQFGTQGDSKKGYGFGVEYASSNAFLIRADYRNEIVNRLDLIDALYYEKEIYSFMIQLIKRW